jgi:acid phosphatase family membrane protein YuiD
MIMDILTNQVFLSVIIASGMTQTWKVIDHAFRKGKLELRAFFSTGGMPSSHSTFVCALATSIGFVEGFTSSVFFLSVGFAAIVLRDAIGVRRAVDNLATTVNSIIRMKKIGVKEILKITGHTPIQVFIGSFIGILIPIFMLMFYT